MVTLAWNVAAASLAPAGASRTEAVPDERPLVDAARDGDEAAFRVLVDRYRDRVFGLALRISGGREAAQEIAQDAFVRAWQALPEFRGDCRFSTWVYRIAYRRALDERAALDRRRTRETATDDAEAAGARAAGGVALTDPSAGTRHPDWATRLRLERCVAALPEAQRTCITLYYAADQSVDDIARVLDVPAGTVKTHLFRARAALREAMGGARNAT